MILVSDFLYPISISILNHCGKEKSKIGNHSGKSMFVANPFYTVTVQALLPCVFTPKGEFVDPDLFVPRRILKV